MKIQKCRTPKCGRSIKTYTRGNNAAPSITKYGSPVRLDAQIVALCARCAKGDPLDCFLNIISIGFPVVRYSRGLQHIRVTGVTRNPHAESLKRPEASRKPTVASQQKWHMREARHLQAHPPAHPPPGPAHCPPARPPTTTTGPPPTHHHALWGSVQCREGVLLVPRPPGFSQI